MLGGPQEKTFGLEDGLQWHCLRYSSPKASEQRGLSGFFAQVTSLPWAPWASWGLLLSCVAEVLGLLSVLKLYPQTSKG